MEVIRTQRNIKHTKPSPFEEVTFLKIPANGKTVMGAVKTVGENGLGKTRHRKHETVQIYDQHTQEQLCL